MPTLAGFELNAYTYNRYTDSVANKEVIFPTPLYDYRLSHSPKDSTLNEMAGSRAH